MAKIGPIIPDRVPASSSSVKQTAQFTKAQVENAERQAAAAKPKEIVKSIVPITKPSVPASLRPPATPKPVIPSWPNGFDGMTGNTNSSNKTPAAAPAPTAPTKTSSKTPDFNSSPYSDVKLYGGPHSSQPFVPSQPSSPVSATPAVPAPLPTVKSTSTKSATTADIIIEEEDPDKIALMQRLLLENIGAQELINIARHDTINGQNIIYRPISNIQDVAIAYNPQNMIAFPDSSDTYFKGFVIKLEAHIPQYVEGEVSTDMFDKPNNVYYNPLTESLVIESIGLRKDYDIEVQMLSSGKVFNGTIYNEDES